MTQKQLILFDGVCNFCNGAVRFIAKRDPRECFVFAPLQSPLGQVVMDRYQLHSHPDTFVLIRDKQCYVMSTAALKVAEELSLPWSWMRVFLLLPKVLRDPFYRLFGRYRYRLFGKSEVCQLPEERLIQRFVGEQVDYLQ